MLTFGTETDRKTSEQDMIERPGMDLDKLSGQVVASTGCFGREVDSSKAKSCWQNFGTKFGKGKSGKTKTADMNFETAGMNSERVGMNSERSGMNSERSGMNSERAGMNSETAGMNSETPGTNSETADMSSETADMNSEMSNFGNSGKNSGRNLGKDSAERRRLEMSESKPRR